MRGVPEYAPVTSDAVRRWPAIRSQRLYTIDEVERFLAKVDARGPDDCWPFTGSPGSEKAVLSSTDGCTSIIVPRMSWELFYGVALGSLRACHQCDTPRCCNPGHVFDGTQADNMRDMAAKGRRRGGHRLPAAQSLDRDSRMYARYQAGGVTMAEIAADYGLGVSAVCRILKRMRGGTLAQERARAPRLVRAA